MGTDNQKKIKISGKYKWVLAVIILSIFLTIAGYWTHIMSNSPGQFIARARGYLSEAKLRQAPRFAKKQYHISSLYYDSAMNSWKQENLKFPLFRDYTISKYYADQATFWAKQSFDSAETGIKELKQVINSRQTVIKRRLEDYKRIYGNQPLRLSDSSKNLIQAWIYYNEAVTLISKENLIVALDKLDSADNLIIELTNEAKEFLKGYFNDHDNWIHQVDMAIFYSQREKSTVLIIDKYARKCYLYNKGTRIITLEIELGTNWIGDKQHSGDKSTPEGTYKVVKKKSRGETKYYKALLLNYPNEDDQARFTRNKSNGVISQESRIGNLIEIHGNGGKGFDWTDGCIALKDQDMDKVYEQCKEGTQVIIVGSIMTFEEVTK